MVIKKCTMKKRIFPVMLMVILSFTSCLPTLQYLQYIFGGYTYNVPDNSDIWSQGWNNYGSMNVNGPYSGMVYTPLPNGFVPVSNFYNANQRPYNWVGNRCNMTFFNQYGSTCQRSFNWRNNQFYWLR